MADDLQTARAVQKAALATKGVLSLGTGRFVEAATYGAGEKISGIVVTPERVEVHIVAAYPLEKPVPQLAEDVRDSVIPEADGREADVVVEDVEVSEE